MENILILLDSNNTVYDTQTITNENDFDNTEYTTEQLKEIGFEFPVLSDTTTKTFSQWIKFKVVFDSDNSSATYTYKPKFVSVKLVNDYCENKVDKIDSSISNFENSINLNVFKQDNSISEINKNINQLENEDNLINQEISCVTNKITLNENRLFLIEGCDYDIQITELEQRIIETQNLINETDVQHEEEINDLKDLVEQNEEQIESLETRYNTIPKLHFMTMLEYKSLGNPDTNGIYFTKE